MHKISKKEYGELVKQIAAKLRKHGMSGSGMYDFEQRRRMWSSCRTFPSTST